MSVWESSDAEGVLNTAGLRKMARGVGICKKGGNERGRKSRAWAREQRVPPASGNGWVSWAKGRRYGKEEEGSPGCRVAGGTGRVT